ncbi:MAG: hypothetical protein ABI645_02665 [Pseudomonadota bacterium]
MNRTQQCGASLLILLTLLTLVVASASIAVLKRAASPAPRRQAEWKSMRQAAEALRGEAMRRRCASPGMAIDILLPCPDSGSSEGQSVASCPGLSRGWLPWRTLGLPPARDSSGTCFWYERQGNGARIIAAGAAASGQDRTAAAGRLVCGGNTNAANYVDAGDAALALNIDATALAARCP